MDTIKLKKFAQFARRTLIEQVGAKLQLVRSEGSLAQREYPEAFKKLEAIVGQVGETAIIERVAYIWFNRFTALRFLDLNELNAVRVVSPLSGQFQPEILADAKAGNINEQVVPEIMQRQIRSLLEGGRPSSDSQAEVYRLLLVAACNYWHKSMPFLFEKIDDFTDLLLPEDLLSNTSLLAYMREAMTPDACQDVEIIGWLYQFYISEKKDQVFAGLKKNVKITAENIPAATQLFTPHWIVRYLVENSLGRLWLLNRPGSKLAERMDYYIAPEEPETDFLRVGKPEEIKLCDPACGSGHMLTYAFDLLYAIYEEEGYEAEGIPALILQHNLTGLEIDDRAGALAAFALAMKAAARLGRRRFLRMEVKPNIVVLQNVTFTLAEMQDVAAVVGRDLFSDELRETLGQFEQAKNFGSLIVPKLRDPAETLRMVEARDFGSDLLLKEVQDRVTAVLRMAEALSPKYHVVVANPPYMGGKGMNGKLGDFAREYYPDSKSDLFAMFMDRSLSLSLRSGLFAMINMQAWMFLSSLEAIRTKLLSHTTLLTMAHLGTKAFDTIGGEIVSTTAFVSKNDPKPNFLGEFVRATDGSSEFEKSIIIQKAADDPSLRFRKASTAFQVLPGQPIAYWAPDTAIEAYSSGNLVRKIAVAKSGQNTGDNARFVRAWTEVSHKRIGFGLDDLAETISSKRRWYPYNKGGAFRRWYGNFENVINWENDGREVKEFAVQRNSGKHWSRYIQNLDLMLKEGITWTFISSAGLGARYTPKGHLFDYAGCSAFTEKNKLNYLISLMASVTSIYFLKMQNPTMNMQPGNIANLPLPSAPEDINFGSFDKAAHWLIETSKSDWDAFETSWDFITLPLLQPDHRGETLEDSYATLRALWQGMTDEMQRLEEENNRIFIDAYGLQDELTPEVPIEEITLTCNPAYRYGLKGSEEDRETNLRADTMAELLSYAVGCMFGRYSLDTPGLILANQGETLADYLARVPNPSFLPDKDNVIPVVEGDWFADDIVDRFRRFLRVSFGEAHFRDNLAFVEAQIGDIRKYFTKGFYEDHVKRYKKRPNYWMFSSPKGTFQALIYMHRYRPDTVSVLLNDYLREFIRKLGGELTRLEKLADDTSASQSQRTRALKDMSTVTKQIAELEEWEREVIFPLAQAKIEIDLDDGVKRNYPKFGAALKTIKGLEEADE